MQILTHPTPALRQRADEIEPATDDSLRDLVGKMARAMYDAPGIGLAATQVGVLKRVLIYDIDDRLVALCNPRIVERSEEAETDEEGCLSVPGISLPVERNSEIVCEAVDLEGAPVTVHASDLLARLIQHEVDHLDGVIILDRATDEDRKIALRKYREALQVG